MPVTINGTTGIAGVDGSAGTPAVQGTDTNTGIFYPAADTIAFGEGGTEVMRIDSAGNVGIGTTSPTQKLDVSGSVNASGTLIMGSSFLRNRIINGAMVIDQRNAGASITPGSGTTFTLDRWFLNATQASKLSVQQNAASVTPPAGFTNYLGVTSLSAYAMSTGDAFSVQQIIEGYNVADFNWGSASAVPATLSFWVRSSLTGTFGGSIATTKTAVWVMPFTYTISSANTWTYISVSVTAPTSTGGTNNDNTAGIYVRFGLGSTGAAAGGTAGTWTNAGNYIQPTGGVSVVGTNGATWYITGVQLEAGTVATPFERRQFGQELSLCQRYFEKTFTLATAPANGATASTFADGGAVAACVTMNSGYGGGYFSFKASKRTNPTITTYGNNSGYWGYGNTNSAPTFSSAAFSPNPSENGIYVTQQVVNNTFLWIVGHWTASAEL